MSLFENLFVYNMVVQTDDFQIQVKLVLDSLCQSKKIATATHNIYAYRITSEDKPDVFYQGCEDDGETQAGSRMLHLMQVFCALNKPNN